jgi:hypothetical protein
VSGLELLVASADTLAPHHARGALVRVDGLDLVEVGEALAADDAARLRGWMAAGQVARVDDATWRAWSALPGDAFELVIVQPFVLVRPMSGAEAP